MSDHDKEILKRLEAVKLALEQVDVAISTYGALDEHLKEASIKAWGKDGLGSGVQNVWCLKYRVVEERHNGAPVFRDPNTYHAFFDNEESAHTFWQLMKDNGVGGDMEFHHFYWEYKLRDELDAAGWLKKEGETK